eukprot:1626035-Amphidinium_carterae.1
MRILLELRRRSQPRGSQASGVYALTMEESSPDFGGSDLEEEQVERSRSRSPQRPSCHGCGVVAPLCQCE